MGNLQITLEELYGEEIEMLHCPDYEEWAGKMDEKSEEKSDGTRRMDEIRDEAYYSAEQHMIGEGVEVHYVVGYLTAKCYALETKCCLLEKEVERLKPDFLKRQAI